MTQSLQDLFLSVLNMSITGSYVILFVLVIRLFLKKAPKIFSYSLWAVVFLRLMVPIPFSTAFSFLGFFNSSSGRLTPIPADIGMAARPMVDLGLDPISNAVNGSLPAATPYASANPLQITIFIYTAVWIIGAAILITYSVYTYWGLNQKTRTAILTESNIYECESIGSPCVIGLIKPKIYLPYGLSLQEKGYILKHEQTHISRFDYLLKPLAFFVACIHWFNPLVWLSFLLAGRDMEMSCDESVLKSMGMDIKKDYSSSLLSFSAGRRFLGGSPLTFGEQNTESRIKNVLSYRRLPKWIVVTILLALIFVSIGLLSNPEGKASFTTLEMVDMADTWANSLKTRDGKPRYEIMSEEMQKLFIEGQKDRSEPWNYNIGVSSPWVTDYEFTINENSVEILYHMTDSTQAQYEKSEVLYFGKENDKTVVIKAEELLSDWGRYSYYAPTADEAMNLYTKALSESDYSTIIALTPSEKLSSDGQQIWDTIKISDVKVINADVRDLRACYELELTIKDGGRSAFEKGVFPRWLWLVKGEQGWYAEGLMTGGAPDSGWWSSSSVTDKETFVFKSLMYLSPLSSSSFDYAESKMMGTAFTISSKQFEIDSPEGEDYLISQPAYKKEPMTEDMIRAFENSTMNKVSLAGYKEKYRYTICTEDGQKTRFYLYVMDNQLWLSSYVDNTADRSEIAMYIWRLE